MIPIHSQISRVIREALWCYENNVRWAEARERIVSWYGHNSPYNAVQNHGFIILGLLYGRDFGDKLCKAVNCGYDTDCTGATLGSLLGIMWGTKGIQSKWKEGVGDKILLHKYTRLDNAPNTVAELTDRVMAIAEKVLEKNLGVKFGDYTAFPDNYMSMLMRNELVTECLKKDIHSSVRTVDGYEVWLHYNGEPVIYPNVGKVLGTSILKDDKMVRAKIGLRVPPGWKAMEMEDKFDQKRFLVEASEVKNRNEIIIEFENELVQFSILGPREAQGYPSGSNVPICPTCHGFKGSCICEGNPSD